MNEDGKKACGYQAANLIQNNMKVGIGTGSTVYYFIERLLQRCEEGLCIQAAFSSEKSRKQALEGKITPIKNDLFTELDITIDGADEIDRYKNMIKGGGGALLREKMLASSSRHMIVVVDESKCVDSIGACKLPIEICPFAYTATIFKINALGLKGEIRTSSDHTFYLTDGGNYIYDLHPLLKIPDPQSLHMQLITIPGVIETGLFYHLADRVLIGKNNGQVEEKTNL
ncbi:MAG: ribose 5-phosphate isomerase A [Simkaniaceae bacterium]|nr:ribose 5-phosphate isomerase A [Simkaniaceae bacterium]